MIDRISVNSLNTPQKQYLRQEPSFKGSITDFVLSGIQLCEAEPMVNVAVADLSTAIIPRTIIEGQTNPYAGFEAFRRESSGLIINCMIPGIIVLGVAKALQNSIMGGDSKMSSCWANEDTIKMITKYWEKTETECVGRTQREKVEHTIKSILEDTSGIDGTETKSLKDMMKFEDTAKRLADEVLKPEVSKEGSWFARRKAQKAANKAYNKAVKDSFKSIIEQTHIAENIKIKGASNGYFSQGLGDVLGNTPKILRELVSGKFPDSATFANKAKKLVTAKSLGGLAIILPLAISAQPINRWLTQRASGKKGAPIYKDFEHAQCKELDSQEKSALFRQKIISIGSMIGVALLSTMKMPSLGMLKNISQFKGIFPSMDQARLISTATFSSRMAASQDKHDLREATSRDIATFCTFYFLGDYVAKGVASALQKTKGCKDRGIKLVNVLDKTPTDAGALKKFWYWAKHTALKSSSEVHGVTADAAKYAKNMRSVCQLANLAFQLITLGIIIPKAYRKKTEKEHEKELKQMEINKQTARHCETSSSGCA